MINIFFFQSLKRKERELEHEMERLAKEKVAQQKKILILKRELAAHTDQDPSFFLSDNDTGIIGNNGRERCKYKSMYIVKNLHQWNNPFYIQL